MSTVRGLWTTPYPKHMTPENPDGTFTESWNLVQTKIFLHSFDNISWGFIFYCEKLEFDFFLGL